MDIDMQHEHGHAAWTWTCSMDMDTQHGFGHVAWTWTVDIHGRRNEDKKLSPASLVFRWFTTLNPASAFRDNGQSGTAGHGLIL
jgi:hypothetical protein